MWAEIEIGDAMELLGPGEAFRDRRVRGYAVKQIARADDEVGRPPAPHLPKLTSSTRSGTRTVPVAIGTSTEI